jgi:hypothetical protein
MKFPKKISEIFRNLRPGPFGLFPKYPTDILGGAGKFVKIYEPQVPTVLGASISLWEIFRGPGIFSQISAPWGRKFLKIDPGEILQQGLNAYTAVSQSNALLNI